MNYKMQIIPDEDEGGYVVYFPELPGCISSAETIEEAIKNALDAQKEWFAAGGTPIGKENILDLKIPNSLFKSLSKQAKEEGIELNNYCLYLLTKNSSSF